MTTIPRNHTRRIREVREAARFCTMYDKDTGSMKPAEIGWAFRALEMFSRARLRVDEPGKKWTVHVHSNSWYTLTVEDPEEPRARKRAESKERERAAREEEAAGREETDAADASNARRRAAAITAVPGFDTHTRAASEAVIDRQRAAVVLRRDNLSASVSGNARAIVAQTVKTKRLQGWSHEKIREHFTGLLKDAQKASDVGRAATAEIFLAVHAGMVADMARPAQDGSAPQGDDGAPVAALGAAPVDDQDQEEAAPVDGEGRVFRAAAWWEKPENAVSELPLPPADGAASVAELPPHEEGYAPEPGAKPYPVRRVHAALEVAGIAVRDTGEEFGVFVGGGEGNSAHVTLHHFRGRGVRPVKGPGRDRWERRRAEIVIALVDAGMTDVELSNGGVWVRVPQPKGARTVVQLGPREYGQRFDAEYIEQAVSFPQYPQVTGWVMRRKWGHGYTGPITPWMYHPKTGEVIGGSAKDEQQAAAALAAHFGMLAPVRVWQP
ncbi:hypothetical protein ACFV42_46545 [Streptomyces solisilvae]|uniref:hypothetical protein n=1 Tax=Streptomyces malaysiensis TaxID=92644 RepID=UPI0036B6A5E2